MAILMLRGIFLAAIFFVFLSAASPAQPRQDKQDNVPPGNTPQKPGDLGSPAEEMLRRAEIRHEEQSHEEMVEHADEAAQIGDEILASYKKNHSLTHDDLKKLERMEKLARKIRGSAGGSDDDATLQDLPDKTEGAVTRLAELSDILKKSVKKTSRLVISAAVIEHSNELIELIRHIRNIQQP
jgi:hypothetical protein